MTLVITGYDYEKLLQSASINDEILATGESKMELSGLVA